MTIKTQTSRRGLVVTAAVAIAVVAGGLVATAAMAPENSKTGSTVQLDSPQDAPASTGPTFLGAGELPETTEAGVWREGEVSAGLPDPQLTCIKDVLPAAGTTYKGYSGDMTAEAREFVTVLQDASAAELVAKEVAQSIERCADVMKAEFGEPDTTWKKYGSYADPANGLSVYGVYFAPPNSEYHLQLFGVGRDGDKVVVLTLSQGGKETEAPVDAFTASARTALEKAF